MWVVPVTGGAPRRMLDNTTHLAWSPDGKRMVYQQYTPGDPLFVAAADGSGARRIFVDQPGRHSHMLAWSPDGRYIYFVRGPHPTREMDVWRIGAEGGEPVALDPSRCEGRLSDAARRRDAAVHGHDGRQPRRLAVRDWISRR